MTKIVIGQDNSEIAESFGHVFPSSQYDVQVANSGSTVLNLIKPKQLPDLIIIDNGLKDPDAFEVCRTIKANPDFSMIPVLFLTEGRGEKDQHMAIEAGCDDFLFKPPNPSVLRARVRSLLRIKYLTDELDDVERVLYTLTRTIEAKDHYTMGHADRVGYYAMELGKAAGVRGDQLDVLRKGGMLHDIGKIAIPDAVLSKPGKYTPDEFEIMKKHPLLGCDICEKLRTVRDALPMIRHHHEKLDGSGYPDGLKGDEISPLIRIVSVVDVYDALRSKRSYKEAFPIDQTFQIMKEESEKGWWDKGLLSTWEKIVRSKPGSEQHTFVSSS